MAELQLFRPWLYVIARHCALDLIRRRRRWPATWPSASDDDIGEEQVLDPVRAIDLAEEALLVYHRQQPDHQPVIRWRFWPRDDRGQHIESSLNSFLGSSPPSQLRPSEEVAQVLINAFSNPASHFKNAPKDCGVGVTTAFIICDSYRRQVLRKWLD